MTAGSKTSNYGAQSVTTVTVENGKQVTRHMVATWAGGDGIARVVEEKKL